MLPITLLSISFLRLVHGNKLTYRGEHMTVLQFAIFPITNDRK